MIKAKPLKLKLTGVNKVSAQESNKASTKPDKQASSEKHSAASQINLDAIILSESPNFKHRLWSAEMQLVPLPVEVAFLFTADGVELGRAIGTAKQVRLTEEQCELVRGGILTHNHPDGSFFSKQDVWLAHKLDLTELRAVQKGTPVQVLSMRRPPKGWGSAVDFEALVESEEIANAAEVLEPYLMKGANLSNKKLKKLADAKWPTYFQERLMHLGYPYESLLLHEPPH
jgi:hypothetical protein